MSSRLFCAVLFEPRPDRGEHSLALGLVDWVAFAVVNGAFIQHVVFIEDGFEVRRLLRRTTGSALPCRIRNGVRTCSAFAADGAGKPSSGAIPLPVIAAACKRSGVIAANPIVTKPPMLCP